MKTVKCNQRSGALCRDELKQRTVRLQFTVRHKVNDYAVSKRVSSFYEFLDMFISRGNTTFCCRRGKLITVLCHCVTSETMVKKKSSVSEDFKSIIVKGFAALCSLVNSGVPGRGVP